MKLYFVKEEKGPKIKRNPAEVFINGCLTIVCYLLTTAILFYQLAIGSHFTAAFLFIVYGWVLLASADPILKFRNKEFRMNFIYPEQVLGKYRIKFNIYNFEKDQIVDLVGYHKGLNCDIVKHGGEIIKLPTNVILKIAERIR